MKKDLEPCPNCGAYLDEHWKDCLELKPKAYDGKDRRNPAGADRRQYQKRNYR